jgi:hypothetical protein
MRLRKKANHPDRNSGASQGSSSGLSPLKYNAMCLVEDKVLSFHIGNKPPVVSHFIAEPLESLQGRSK